MAYLKLVSPVRSGTAEDFSRSTQAHVTTDFSKSLARNLPAGYRLPWWVDPPPTRLTRPGGSTHPEPGVNSP